MEINKTLHLSEHFTLGEVTKSRHEEIYNIPSHVAIENLKRVCEWLEELRRRYNERYVFYRNEERSVSPPELGGVRGGLKKCQTFPRSDHPTHTGTPPNLGGEKDTSEAPIIITSGYRSPELNIEQAMRYAVILMDYADETKQDYDELLIERNKNDGYWLHFAVRPKDNRRKTMFLQV